MSIGTVKWFDVSKGFGFIGPHEGGADLLVHITALQSAGLAELREGQVVSYELEPDQRGTMPVGQLKVMQ